MAKKSKKKTIASTRKKVDELVDAKEKKIKDKKVLGRIFSGKRKNGAKKNGLGSLFKGKKTEKPFVGAVDEPLKGKDESPAGKIEVIDENKQENPVLPEKRIPIKSPVKRRVLKPRRNGHRIKGGILAFTGIFVLIFFGYFIFGKIFSPQPFADLLPYKSTIAFVEVDVDGSDAQTKQFYSLMKKYQVYSPANIIRLFDFVTPLDFTNEIEPWLGRRIGAAMSDFKDQEGRSRFSPIFIFESRDNEKALDFMKGRALIGSKDEIVTSDYSGFRVYSYKYSHNINFTFINNYLLLTIDENTLHRLLDSVSGGETKLGQDSGYRKVSNNLAHGGLIFGYVNMAGLYDALVSDPAFISQKGRYFATLRPFLEMFGSIGVSLFAEENRFAAQTFTTVNDKSGDGTGYISFQKKYQGNLLSLADISPVLLAGGYDLTKEFQRIEELFDASSGASTVMFDGFLESQKQKYFGNTISLKNDIYPLFKGEYLLTVGNSFEQPQIVLSLEMTDKENNLSKMEKLIDAFVKTSGIFSPQVRTVTLPDGTAGKEIVSSREQITRLDQTYEGLRLITLKLGETDWSLYIANDDKRIIAGTDHDAVKREMDRAMGKGVEGFVTTEHYESSVVPAMRNADEIINLKVGAVTGYFGLNENPSFRPYLMPFSDLAVTKNYFTDGISTIYLLEVI